MDEQAARRTGRLTALKIARLRRKPGMHADGDGLYLQGNSGGGSWILRYMRRGRARYMGLGPASSFSLKQARLRAQDARRLLHDGIDPIDAKREANARAALDAAKSTTFKECADTYIKMHQAGWRNAKHAAQWQTTLTRYVEPIIGALSVQSVDTALVMKVLEQGVRQGPDEPKAPLWEARPETASRIRGRIEAILDWARVRGYREGENPARWRGHLATLLPARAKVRQIKHHAALPYDEMPEFMVALRAQDGMSARALEFAILTAARTGEVLGARWSEIDTAGKVWTVPAERMKAGKQHRVPLSARAVALLDNMTKLRQVSAGQREGLAFVFPGAKAGEPLSNMALLMLLRRMGRDELTAHGFRSTFRDWAAERTSYPSEVAEMALAHAVADKVEAAYRRGDLFERRRKLADAWASYCATAPKQRSQGNVASLRRTA